MDDLFVTDERVFPRVRPGVADLRRRRREVGHRALILLEGRDLLRVGRPDHDRLIRMFPAGIVRCVAEILDAIGRQLPLRAGVDVAYPQIPVAQEYRTLAVRGGDRRRPAALRRGGCGLPSLHASRLRALIRLRQRAGILLATNAHDRGVRREIRLQSLDEQLLRVLLLQPGRIERCQQCRRLEGRGLGALQRIAQHDRRHAVAGVHIPEVPRIYPMRGPHRVVDQGRCVRAQLMHGAIIVGGGHSRSLLRGRRPGNRGSQKQAGDQPHQGAF
jgi:hypothetical protein